MAMLMGCAGPQPERPLNVFLITLDTTRADHIGCYGHDDIQTPTIDGLAAEGTLYARALSPVPITLPAHTSILTGTYPLFHGVRDNNGFYVSEESTTLAEILGEQGYDTAAVVGAFSLDSQTNLDQGFQLYDDNYPSATERGRHPSVVRFYDERPASEVGLTAMSWLRERDPSRPFFLWAHFWDPHQPQAPPEPYRSRYAGSQYDGEIAFVDEVLGQVLRLLEDMEQLDNTLIVLTADHGEGLGEHGEVTHALLTHSATLQVPLIIRDPAELTPRRIEAAVSTVDIFPTVLDRLGIEPPVACQGHILPSDPDAESTHELIFGESAYGTVNFGWSMVERLSAGHWTLMGAPVDRVYNHVRDPAEVEDLVDLEPGRAEELRGLLDLRRAELAANAIQTRREVVAPEVSARLAALGYLGSADSEIDPAALRVDANLPNPWDMMDVADALNEANNLLDAGKIRVAIPIYQWAHRRDPGNSEIPRRLAISYMKAGDLERAKSEIDRLLEMAPESVGNYVALADYFRLAGEIDRGLEPLERAIELDPKNVSTYRVLAWLQEKLDRHSEAASTYRIILELEADDPAALNALAVNLYQSGKVAEPTELLQRVLDTQPFFPPAHLNLAVIDFEHGDHQQSLRLVDRALRLRPRYLKALELRAMNLEAMNDSHAPDAWRRVLEIARDADTRHRAAFALDRLDPAEPTQ